MPDSFTIAAHAKANLFLRVLAREVSGFHTLETLFVLLQLADRLTAERIPNGIELTVEGAETGHTLRRSRQMCTCGVGGGLRGSVDNPPAKGGSSVTPGQCRLP